MSALKLTLVILLISSGAALAQGTEQRATSSGGNYNGAEPIGRSGTPVPTSQSGMFANPLGQYTPPATRNNVIVVPRRRR